MTDRNEETDWVGQWYVVGRERGLNDIFIFATFNTATGMIERHHFSHTRYDGIGAFAELLRARGFKLHPLPSIKKTQRPGFWQRFGLISKVLKASGPNSIAWSDYDRSRTGDPHEFSWVLFSRDETRKLDELAHARKVSKNALLLEALSKTVLPHVVSGSGQWVFPINLRGAVDKERDTSNHSSGVAIVADATTSAQEIDSQIRNNLKSGLHWATWWLLNIGRIVGLRGVRALSKMSEKKSQWFGTFTNMGDWPPQEPGRPKLDPNEAWMVAAPGTKNYPISVGCLTWNGQLAVTLKLHPAICADRTLPSKLIQDFKRRVLGESIDHNRPLPKPDADLNL